MEFHCEKYKIEKKNSQEQYNFQRQNYKRNKDHNYDADALFHRSDHYNRDDIVFLKAVLQCAHNCVSTETILRTIPLRPEKHLL